MKKRTIIILSLFSVATALIAATLTIDIPAADVPRVTEAYGNILGLKDANGSPRPATQQEVQAAVRKDIIDTTKDYERRKNTYQYTPPNMEMQPSPTPTATVGGLAAPQSKTEKKK